MAPQLSHNLRAHAEKHGKDLGVLMAPRLSHNLRAHTEKQGKDPDSGSG